MYNNKKTQKPWNGGHSNSPSKWTTYPYFQGMLHPMVAYLGLGKLHRNKLKDTTTRLVRFNPTQSCFHHGSQWDWHSYQLHNWVNPGLLGAPQLSVSGLEADELGRHKPNDRTLRVRVLLLLGITPSSQSQSQFSVGSAI